MTRAWLRRLSATAISVVAVMLIACGGLQAHADSTTQQAFALQISPSPIVATIKPGVATTLELQIRNTANSAQDLVMGLKSFSIDAVSGQVRLGNSAPDAVTKFVSFANPTFSLQPGQIFTQHIIIDTPADAGFTYTFAVTISQQHPPQATKGGTTIQGSVADFTLLSVDRPGATAQLGLTKLASSHRVYEYLPASFTLTFKNTGNTLLQPKGTIYVQRQNTDGQALATIPINPADGYILPGSSRTLTSTWSDGFPHYKTVTLANGQSKRQLSWGGNLSKLRIGKFTAKVVAVYNDNGRDVPLSASITFWVIPWRMLLGLLVLSLLMIVGAITIIRKSSRALHHKPPSRANDKTRS